MTRCARLLILLSALAALLCAQAKKRVAVLDFDYATVQNYVASVFGTNRDVGKGIADILVQKLVADGTYSVVERKAIDKILAEQNFSNSDRADPNTATKLGRILGVDAIVMGSVTQFGRDDKSTSVGGGALGGITGRYGLGGVQRRQAKALVTVTARMINTDTAEILVAASGTGESARSGTSLLGAGGSDVGAGGGAYDMTSKNFASTLIGEATTKAVAQLAGQLEQSSSQIAARKVVIDGLVADVSGKTLILNIGSRAGLKVGDRIEIRRKIRDIKDPATGKVIRSLEDDLGSAVITEVQEGSSTATYNGAGTVKVGDSVKGAQ